MPRDIFPTSPDNTPSNVRIPSSAGSRRTFGVLLDRMALYPGGYEEELRRQFHDAAEALDVNLRVLYGDGLLRAGAKATGGNALYDLFTPASIDGIVAVSSSLEAGCGAQGLTEFLSRYRPLPVCSVGIELPDVPSIVVSGTAAVQDLVTHLVVQHGVRSVLFLEGRPNHPESLERRAACESAMQRLLGAAPCSRTGNFSRHGGYQATLDALDQGVEFDAVVAANDHMALGALKALRERGLGRERPVTGFDDLDLARVCHPPLTTVAQPFRDVAVTALAHLMSEIAGVRAPLRTEFSAKFLLRQSCGCSEHRARSTTPVFDIGERFAETSGTLDPAADVSSTSRGHSVSRLLGALAEAQAELRQELLAEHARFLTSGDSLSSARDRAGVARALHETLRSVGLEDACISTFVDPGRSELSLLAAGPVAEQVPGAASRNDRFPAIDLVPDWWRSSAPRHTLLVLPLAVEDTCFGVAAFGYPCAGFGPQIIAHQVALAMRNVALHEAVIEQTVRSERSLQERRAAAERLEWIGALAGSVAHELNNALGPLVALPEVMIEELSELSGDPDTLDNLRQDVEAIRAAAERATGTILDLLTLGRRGRVPNTVLDLNQSAAEAARAKTQVPGDQRTLELDLYDGELMVSASSPQLSRALSHLLKNAEQATFGGGCIRIRTSRVGVTESLRGYETVPPGRYALLEISDDGPAIQGAKLERIFEPYHSSHTHAEGNSKSLGLALVHAVVKEHEGFIDVASDPACGTAFRLYFPLAGTRSNSENPNALPTKPAETGRLEGLRILVVDDEVAQLKTAERLLTREGCHVETVNNGGEAYQRFRDPNTQLGYDLILLDVTLNEASDGIDWLERIQAVAPGQHCILMSGHAAPARAERALGKGVPWLVKPYTPEALVAMVDSVLTRGPASPGFFGD